MEAEKTMKKQINESVFFEQVSGLLDERSRRLVAAGLAITFGHGGLVRVSQASGLSRTTIQNGVQELKSGSFLKPNKVHSQRSEGGGRKVIEYVQPEIIKDMESLIEPHVSGNPESPLRWSSMSLRKLSDELGRRGHVVSYVTVRRLLEEQGYTLQSNKKSHEGKSVVDRNEQFEHINETAKAFLAESQPIISVDAKKKELVGEFKNNGKEYRLSGHPRKVNVYDFIDPTLGKAAPYGVYDSTENEGFVSVGISHDTAEFAVETIEKWWKLMGKQKYTDAHSLFITADGGG